VRLHGCELVISDLALRDKRQCLRLCAPRG
jgi:hypothetical protein